jgi:hypothetical protein
VSTNIVVDVALSALRQLNQAQVNANRQAKLLADRNSTLAQKAVEADAAAKAQPGQGQDPRGALLYGVKSDRKRPQENPIAVYRGSMVALEPSWLLAPSDAGFNAIVRGLEPFQFLEDTASYRSTHYSLFSTSGPSGANRIQTSTSPTENPPLAAKIYSSVLYADSIITAAPAGGAFTFELFAKIPPAADTDYPSSTNEYSYADVHTLYGFCRIYLGLDYIKIANPFDYAQMGNIFIQCAGNTYRATGASNVIYPIGEVNAELNDFDRWHHIAITQEPDGESSSKMQMYLNGSRVAMFSYGAATFANWLSTWSPISSDTFIELSYGENYLYDLEATSSSVHGIRFTPRALYSGASFTPPTSITSLA